MGGGGGLQTLGRGHDTLVWNLLKFVGLQKVFGTELRGHVRFVGCFCSYVC